MLLGVALLLLDSFLAEHVAARSFLEALASECVVWGLAEAGISFAALKQAQAADRASINDANVLDRELADCDRLVRLLTFCSRIVTRIFIAIGIILLIAGAATARPALVGHGLGIAVHSGFLLLLTAAMRFLLISLQSFHQRMADKLGSSIDAPRQGR